MAVQVIPADAAIPVGDQITIVATPQDKSGKPVVGTAVKWTTSDSSVAAVSTQGVVTALGAGSVTISAKSGDKTGNAALRVSKRSDTSAPPPVVASVAVTPGSTTLAIGRTVQLAAIARDASGVVLTGRTTAWVSSSNAVATVSATGLVSGVAAGTATLTATIDGVRGTAIVTVPAAPAPPPSGPAPVASVVVTPAGGSLIAGATLQLVATLKDAAGNPLTGRVVTWTSSNPLVATVSAGLVSGIVSGTATVIATSEGTSTSVSLTVNPAPIPGVPINPGESIQAKVDANLPGTQFVIKAGTHRRQSVVPKTGMAFIGEPGAILDGENVTAYAFRPGNAPLPVNVRIQGLIIQHYAPPVQLGAILAGGHQASDQTSGWVVEGCEVRYNATMGIRLGHQMQVLRNNVHHNGQIGIGGVGDDVLVDGNEIAYNNYLAAYSLDFEAGGTKFVLTRRLVVRRNFVHHNVGPGLWTDIDNINTLYENNRVEDNAREGIVHEISYAAVIRNNTVLRNGLTDPSNRFYLWNAGIAVHASPDVEVYGNTVSGNLSGIVAIQQERGTGTYGPHLVQNLYVHDNSIVQIAAGRPGDANAAAGMAQDVGDVSIFSNRNNRFANNTYFLGANTTPFSWMNANRTETGWRGYGQDLSAVFNH